MDDIYGYIKQYFSHLADTGYSNRNNGNRLLTLLFLSAMLRDYTPTEEQGEILRDYYRRCICGECF